MNASVLLLSSVLLAGADPVPVVTAAPIAGVTAGCGGCSAPASCAPDCAPSCGRVGLLDRLRARLAARRAPKCQPVCTPAPAPCCAPAPAPAPTPCCGTPVFTGFTTSCADPCDRVGLLARLRAKFHGSRHCDACSVPHTGCTVGCGAVVAAPAAPATPAPTPATTPPANMPKPDAGK